MEKIYALPRTDEQALRHLQSCLNKYDFGTKEYELARKTFAWLCAKFRTKSKINSEQYR